MHYLSFTVRSYQSMISYCSHWGEAKRTDVHVRIGQPTTIPNTSEREATFQTGISGAGPLGCSLSLSTELPVPMNHNTNDYTCTYMYTNIHVYVHIHKTKTISWWVTVQFVGKECLLLASLTSIVLLNLTLQHLDAHEGTEETIDIQYTSTFTSNKCKVELTWSCLAAILFR